MAEKQVALTKYNAISRANKIMFASVAGASVIAGAAIVGVAFLFQDFTFNAKRISEQDKSISNIEQSKRNVEELKQKLQALRSNSSLLDAAIEDETALQVVLDSLPSEANSTAIGSSLSEKILKVENVSLESMSVDTIAPEDPATAAAATTPEASSPASTSSIEGGTSTETISSKVKTVGFSFVVSAKQREVVTNGQRSIADPTHDLLNVLVNMEKSIRTFAITSYSFERSKESATMTVSGNAYYLPSSSLQLTTKTIKSDETKKSATSSASSSTTTGGTQ